MGSNDDQQSPMAAAMEWVARIMGAAAMMVLPGLAGQWLDKRLGTSWIVLAGFAIGLTLSMYYLLAITRPPKNTVGESAKTKSTNKQDPKK